MLIGLVLMGVSADGEGVDVMSAQNDEVHMDNATGRKPDEGGVELLSGTEQVTEESVAEVTVGDDTKYYDTISEAFGEAQKPENKGCALKMLKDIPSDNDDTAEIKINVVSGEFTLDLNGHTLGEASVNSQDSNKYKIDVSNSKITVVSDESKKIFGVLNMNIYLNDGAELVVPDNVKEDTYIHLVNIKSETASFSLSAPKVRVSGVQLDKQGNVQLSGGSYNSVSWYGVDVTAAGLLADGYVFKKWSDDTIVPGDTKNNISDSVKVIPCPHSRRVDNTKCEYCGTELMAMVSDDADGKENVLGYKTIQEAFASVGDSVGNNEKKYIKLLKSAELNEDLIIENKKISYSALDDGVKLTFTDGHSLIVSNGGYFVYSGNINAITVGNEGKIDADESSFVQTLTVFDTSKLLFQNGKFGKIIIKEPDKNVSDILFKIINRTYRHTTEGMPWATEEEMTDKEIENVEVVNLPFINASVDADNINPDYNPNGKVTLSAHATQCNLYSGAVTYEWYKNNVKIEDASSNTYTENAPNAGKYTYKCIISCEGYSKTVSCDVNVTPRNLGNENDSSLSFDYVKSYAYNGEARKPGVYVKFNDTYLKDGDFTVTYPDETTNVGEKEMTVTGLVNFSGERKLKYTITPCTTIPTVTLSQTEYTYDGQEKRPTATVIVGGRTLTEGKDYEISYNNNRNAGTATVTVKGCGNYGFETMRRFFTIKKADSVVETAPRAETLVYDGLSHYLVTGGTVNGGMFEYKLGDGGWNKDVPRQKDAGKYTVWYRVRGDENHNNSEEKSIDVTIGKRDIADAKIVLFKSLTYNGEEQEQEVFHVRINNKLNATFSVTNNRATTAGTYTLTVTGVGNFTGVRYVDFTIARKAVKANVTVNGVYTYNKNAINPTDITVKDGNTLIPSDEYTLSYENNTNAGTAKVSITNAEGGNYIVSGTGEFVINKANIKVKPKDVIKIYGGEPVFALESGSPLITPEELTEVTKTAKFTSDGAAKTAPVSENGYVISAQLANKETDNLIFEVDGTGVLTVTPAPLTITVNDVRREYGAANPELSVSYNGFVNGEDESVLNGTLTIAYDESINGTTPVNTYDGKTTASGLSAKNYNINYVPGKVTITKIPVSVTAGAARRSYLSVEFDKSLEGLAGTNFVVKDSEGNTVAVTNVTASSDSKTYTLSGSFEVGRKYTVKVVLNGAAVETTHHLVNDEIVSIPVRVSSGGGGGSTGYTVSFDTNGGSKLANQRVKRNSVITEPTAPTKEGFDFAGWYTDKELKTKYNFSAKVTKSMTIYAAWTEKDNSANQIILTIGEKKALVFGKTKINDVAPKMVNDRTMLPARFVAENLGADVSWNEDKELVAITGKNLKTGENVTILVNIDSDVAYVNGREVKLDSPAFIENDRTYTPIRFISEELGASVEWFETGQKVVITK